MASLGLSNAEFGRRVGINASYASYLRNGTRTPGARLLVKIVMEFFAESPQLPIGEFAKGPAAFSALLRSEVFGVSGR